MTPETLTLVALGALVLMILIGIPIGLSLAATALVGTALLFGSWELVLRQGDRQVRGGVHFVFETVTH